jgi:hypothetical protein
LVGHARGSGKRGEALGSSAQAPPPLPFVMVDLVVSAVLMALGMQMMSPTVVSTPLKLLLFVAVDGWSRLLQGLILTYAPVA